MKRMGIETLNRKSNTSKPAPCHKIYPYLLRNLAVTRPNCVWVMDVTCIPLSGSGMARGFIYLVAVLDRATRRIQAWPGSITLDSSDFIKALADRKIQISMDEKGAWRDDVFAERLWRGIK